LHLARARLARDPEASARQTRHFAAIDWQRPLIVATMHRRESHGPAMAAIIGAIADLAAVADVVIPVHPNPSVERAVSAGLAGVKGVHLMPPLDYPAFVWLLGKATLALTDSGGIQEEAPALGVPVLVMRDVTERTEGIASGNACLVGTNRNAIVAAAMRLLGDFGAWRRMAEPSLPYGAGDAAERIARSLAAHFGQPASSIGDGARAHRRHHRAEAGKARADRPGIVDSDGLAGVEAEDGKAHGDAVVELGGNRGTAGNGLAA
jgi:UDP-N-acetylglucosamine 2-epimerase (non-hydrolysing)